MDSSMMGLALCGTGILLGLALAALRWVPLNRRLRRELDAQTAVVRNLSDRIPVDEVEARLKAQEAALRESHSEALARQESVFDAAMQATLQDAEAGYAQRFAAQQKAFEARIAGLCAELLSEHASVINGIESLLGIVRIVERWHDEMQAILSNNSELKGQNAEFSHIVKNVVILSLNASIEAARSGEHGLGFAVVADGVRDLANTASRWAQDYKQNLDKNDFITTTTFQDMQASGNMIRTAVLTLKAANERIGQTITNSRQACPA